MGRRTRRRGERDEDDGEEGPSTATASLCASLPLYEYKCPNGHLFEVIHGMTEDSPQVCEVCGEAPLQRVLHPVAVHYKGSGFYSTDYGRKSAKQSSKEESSSSSDSSSTSSSDSTSGSGSGETKKAAEA